jgi:DNA-binding NarL/FixJ family response regulator
MDVRNDKNGLVKVFAIDDEPSVLLGLKNIFRGYPKGKGIRITGTSDSIDYALLCIKDKNPDIILLEPCLRKTNPVENVVRLKQTFPAKPIVIFTSSDFNEFKIHPLYLYPIDKGKEQFQNNWQIF